MRTREDVEREIELAQKGLDKLASELDTAFVTPDEPPVGSVIKFQVQYDPFGPVYNYAALRFKDGTGGGQRWAFTGGSTRLFTWTTLVELMMRDLSIVAGHAKLTYSVAKPKDFKERTA